MKDVVFVTSNQRKADYLSALLGYSLKHSAVDQTEIQSSDVVEVAKVKALRAYEVLQVPVLVEDVSLEFQALNGLPGPFIKFFVSSDNGLEMCCRMLDGFDDRNATARSVFVYHDGENTNIFEGGLNGTIAMHPKGENGWDWDHIFCPNGFDGRSRAELSDKEDMETYLSIKPIDELKLFLEKL